MNRSVPTALCPSPWYKEPWPWLLMSLPLTAIVAGLATWGIAYRSDDGLVAKDYYKQGMTINRVLARQERAVQMGLTAEFRHEGDRVILQLESNRALAFPSQLRLSLINPARAGLDQTVMLRYENGRYIGGLGAIRDGRWNLKLEDEGGVWQLFAETSLPVQTPVRLKP